MLQLIAATSAVIVAAVGFREDSTVYAERIRLIVSLYDVKILYSRYSCNTQACEGARV